MKLLAEKSYHDLVSDLSSLRADNARLKERNAALSARVRDLERRLTEISLELGLQGYRVEEKPPVPAQAARMVVRKAPTR